MSSLRTSIQQSFKTSNRKGCIYSVRTLFTSCRLGNVNDQRYKAWDLPKEPKPPSVPLHLRYRYGTPSPTRRPSTHASESEGKMGNLTRENSFQDAEGQERKSDIIPARQEPQSGRIGGFMPRPGIRMGPSPVSSSSFASSSPSSSISSSSPNSTTALPQDGSLLGRTSAPSRLGPRFPPWGQRTGGPRAGFPGGGRPRGPTGRKSQMKEGENDGSFVTRKKKKTNLPPPPEMVATPYTPPKVTLASMAEFVPPTQLSLLGQAATLDASCPAASVICARGKKDVKTWTDKDWLKLQWERFGVKRAGAKVVQGRYHVSEKGNEIERMLTKNGTYDKQGKSIMLETMWEMVGKDGMMLPPSRDVKLLERGEAMKAAKLREMVVKRGLAETVRAEAQFTETTTIEDEEALIAVAQA